MKNIINHYSQHVLDIYGQRVQKISIDAGFTCPNRDGTKGIGGCTFCNNDSFSTGSRSIPIEQQISNSIEYFKKRRPNLNKFIVYFQSYTNTYANLSELKKIYNQALSINGVIGISIGTRPDCLEDEKIDFLNELGKKADITLEIGAESCYDTTLKQMNRGHDFECFRDTILRCQNKNFKTGTHIILGHPNENREMMINSFKTLGKLPIHYLKIHQLLVVKNTALASQYLKSPFPLLTQEEYVEILAEGLTYIPQEIVIQRVFSTTDEKYLISPKWTNPVNSTLNKLEEFMKSNSYFQGMNYI